MRNIFKINIFTYLFFLLYILSGFYKDILIIYLILFIHEIGHYVLMKIYNISIHSITFYPYGGMIKSNMLVNTKSLKVLIISLGGILSQLILLGIFYILLKFNVIDFNIFNIFYKYNSYIMFFNLFPMYPLDGFKILTSIYELFYSFKKSVMIGLVVNFIFIIIFSIYLYIYKISNYVIIMFLLVSLINYIKEYNYLINNVLNGLDTGKLDYSGLVSVNDIGSLYKNKFNYINGKNEKYVLRSKYKI